LFRQLGVLVLVALVLLAVVRLFPGGGPGLGLDPTAWPDAWHTLDLERQRGGELDERMKVVVGHHETKAEIVAKLAAGAMTLNEAVIRVRELCVDLSPVIEELQRHDPCNSDEECLCRHLISWVWTWLEAEPARQQEVVSRLQDEMQACLRR
jgi:hypothetical protein